MLRLLIFLTFLIPVIISGPIPTPIPNSLDRTSSHSYDTALFLSRFLSHRLRIRSPDISAPYDPSTEVPGLNLPEPHPTTFSGSSSNGLSGWVKESRFLLNPGYSVFISLDMCYISISLNPCLLTKGIKTKNNRPSIAGIVIGLVSLLW